MTHATPPWRHLLLALAVVAVWGSNFVVIKLALAHLPPLLFAALRFALAFFPAVLLLPRPAASWRNLAAYGVLIGVGQFGVLYLAMKGNISPGLASLVIQTQVFFTIVLAMRVARERVQPYQWLALALGAGGIAVIGAHTGGDTTALGLLMVSTAGVAAVRLENSLASIVTRVESRSTAWVMLRSCTVIVPLEDTTDTNARTYDRM